MPSPRIFPRKILFRLSLLILTTSAPSSLLAQTPSQPAAPATSQQLTPHEGSPYVLHLYARLVELPTLILGPNDRPLRSLGPKSMNIKLDLRPPFHPTSIRLEGNDPISLAILIDTRGEQFPLLTAFQNDFSTWLTKSFGPLDRISLYAMNCDLFRSAFDRPPNPTLLQPALDQVIASAMSKDQNNQAACAGSAGLRDYIDYVMKQSSTFPGRRVILFLANGDDDKGTARWQDLVSDATLYAVTTFGINVPDSPLLGWGGSFEELSQRSGGLNMPATPDALSTTLSQVIDLLRQRYILQFPMPADLTGDVHQVFVTVDKSTTVIRPSGITVPLNDPSTRTGSVNIPVGEPSANPTTSQPSATPPPSPQP